MVHFDFLKFCTLCKFWCCREEKPYASKEELKKLGVDTITTNLDGSCMFLKNKKCEIYPNRPFECRIFPFDIHEIDGKLVWVCWETCHAYPFLNIEEFINFFEKEFPKKWSIEYLWNYLKHHENNEPLKYSKLSFKVIREVKWSNEQM